VEATQAIPVKYDMDVVRWFTIMAVIYLVVGTLLGVYIASELAWPFLNFYIPYITFGRLRPLHTNSVIFAFGGCTLMATGYYIVQRTGAAKLWSNGLAWFTFWGWNLIIVLAVITLPLGMTQGKEYAELEWPIDILIAVVWVAFGLNYIMTIAIRKSSHIYVSNWFFMSMIIMITYLHVVNSLAIPVSLTKSYSIYSGVQDAMIQWWWGHNAVGFYLTAGFLGIMYYFVPKQANRPVFSYRLSVLHFWALTFGYVWLGAHHLQYTALPDWTGSLGAAISLAMIIPSWGGAMNGMMTLSGAWDRLRHRLHPALPGGVSGVLCDVHLRGTGNVHQDSECVVTLHRLDHRSRAFRCAGLGGNGFRGCDLPYDQEAVAYRNVFRPPGQCALLDGDDWHRDLRRGDVGVRHHAGSDVA